LTSVVSRDEEWKALLDVFLTESLEMLDEVEPRLVELERSFACPEAVVMHINAIFRLFHSLKGGAAALAINNVRDLTHKAETLLELLREGKKIISHTHLDLMYKTCDLIRRMLRIIAQNPDDKSLDKEVGLLSEEINSENALEQNELLSKTSEESLKSQDKIVPASKKSLPESLVELKIDITPEMIQHFTDEAEELLEDAEQALMEQERTVFNGELILRAFRSIHSFKGNAGFFGFTELENVGHAAENVLGKMRDKEIPPDKTSISGVLAAIDMLRDGISQLKTGKNLSLEKMPALLERLQWMIKPSSKSSTNNAPKLGEVLVSHGIISDETLQEALKIQQEMAVGRSVESENFAVKESVEPSLEKVKPMGDVSIQQHKAIRVDIDKLDKLLELVGEIVIAESNVSNCPEVRNFKVERFNKELDRLTKITKDLQRVSMSLRMIPLVGLFRKMVRPVRDLAKSLGKKVELKFLGEETEVDKNVIELLSDPLMHIIRNAVDHGIEPTHKRIEQGKKEVGTIILEGRHSGGEVWVIVSDDGHGLDKQRIIDKVRQVGLIKTDGSELSDHEVFDFIFEPGFSTAEHVTEISGRGVGMDVVRKNVEKLKGRVDVRTTPGMGTIFTIRLPLTLSIIEGMVIRVGKERFIIPTQAIVEFFKPTKESVTTITGKGEIVSIRGRMMAMFRVASLLGIAGAETDSSKGNVMVVEEFGKTAGFLVDEILGQQQTVIKSLGAAVNNAQGITGAAVMPDGKVGLVLDPAGILKLAMHR